MRVMLPAALLLVALALAGAGAAAPAVMELGEGAGVHGSLPSPSALPAAPPNPASPAWPAAEPADVPQLTGPSVIVGRAARLASGPDGLLAGGFTTRDLQHLAAEQQLAATLQPIGSLTWALERAGEIAPLPAATLVAPQPLRPVVPPQAALVGAAAGGAALLALALPKLPLLPLYSRIEREEAMLNARRAQMYQLVRGEPGIHLSDLVRRTGLGWGAALYHLNVLEKSRVVVAHQEGGFKRYFANGQHPRDDMARFAALRHDAARALFEAVQADPGRNGRQLAQALGLSPSTLARASERLEDAGLLRRERSGRKVLYYPAEPAPGAPAAAPPAALAAA